MVIAWVASLLFYHQCVLRGKASGPAFLDLPPWPDAPEYFAGAVELARTGQYGFRFNGQLLPSRYPPGFSLYVAPFVPTLEPGQLVLAPIRANHVLGLILLAGAGGFFAVQKRYWAAGAVVLLLAFHPGFVHYARSPMSDLLGVALLFAAAGFVGLAIRRDHLGWLAGCAVCLGLAVAVRLQLVFAAPMLLTPLMLGRPWRRRVLATLLAGALLGLSSLSGYPAMTLLTGVLAAAWGLARGFTRSPAPQAAASRSPRLRQLGWAGLMVALVGAVSLTVFFPAYRAFTHETAGFSTRHGAIARDVATRYGIGWANLATAVSPSINVADSVSAARSAERQQMIQSSGSCGSIYAGMLLLVLAVAGVATRPRDLFRWLLAVLMLLFFAAALTDGLPVYGWLYDYFPPIRYSQRAFVVRDYGVFLVAVLAALTLRDLVQAPSSERRRVWFAAAAASLVIAALVPLAWHWTGVSRGLVERYHLAWLADVGLCVAAGAVLFRMGRACSTGSRQRSAGNAALAALLLLAFADAGLSWYWNQPITAAKSRGYVRHWRELEAGHSTSMDIQVARSLGTWIDNHHLIAKAPRLRGYTVLRNPAYLALDDNGALAQLAAAADRFWFAPQATASLPNWPKQRKKGKNQSAATRPGVPGNTILQVTARDAVISPREAGAAQPLSLVAADRAEVVLQPAQVQVRRYDPTRLQLEGSFPEPGWLLVTDRWSPSWHARVNGQEIPVHRGQAVFRAVQVPAGACTIEFWFDPPYRRWIWISWLTLAAVAALSIVAVVRRGRL